MISNKRTILFLACSTLLLAACDLPFLGDEEAKIEAKRLGEGMAVGSGCRYSNRPLEECYGMNPKMSKAAIFAGWRDMDGYMRDNNIQAVSPESLEAPAKKTENGEEAPKAAEAPPADEKSKAVEAPKEAPPGKQGVRIHKLPRRVV